MTRFPTARHEVPGEARLSVHVRETGVDAVGESLWSCSQTKLFKPLAYPSTLDRRSGVLRGGALEPDALRAAVNSQAKAHANAEREFQAGAQRVFLSQAGPRFELERSHSEHHLHS